MNEIYNEEGIIQKLCIFQYISSVGNASTKGLVDVIFGLGLSEEDGCLSMDNVAV